MDVRPGSLGSDVGCLTGAWDGCVSVFAEVFGIGSVVVVGTMTGHCFIVLSQSEQSSGHRAVDPGKVGPGLSISVLPSTLQTKK